MPSTLQSIVDLPGIKKLRSGKVREVFDLGATLLFVVTDRLSAFDVILPDPIPSRCSAESAFRFLVQTLRQDRKSFHHDRLRTVSARAATVSRTAHRPVHDREEEQTVRGGMRGARLSGRFRLGRISKNAERLRNQTPAGVAKASKLPEPIFTPSTKAEQGHDENIDMKECARILGDEMANRVKDLSLKIYSEGREHAVARGIIVADTKFEFGTIGDELLLIDECLTPDSSRFWPADQYVVGQSPPSFDKQFVRDYLETLDWNKTPPGPKLPREIIEKTAAKYREAFERLTGTALA